MSHTELPDAPEQTAVSCSAKSGSLGERLALDILMDSRIRKLTPRTLGVFILLKAHHESHQTITANITSGAKSLGLTSKVFQMALEELQASKPPLIMVIDDDCHPQSFGRPIKVAVQKVRSEAAKERWANQKNKQHAEPAQKIKPARKKKQPPVVAIVDGFAASTVVVSQTDLFANDSSASKLPGDLTAADAALLQAGGNSTPYAAICNLFNTICKSLPSIRNSSEWGSNRTSAVSARWAARPDLEWWQKFFSQVDESDFLCGRAGQFKATFDWIITQSNFLKIIEGNYATRHTKAGLFGQGDTQFSVGSYGGHEIDLDAPWIKSSQSKGNEGAQ